MGGQTDTEPDRVKERMVGVLCCSLLFQPATMCSQCCSVVHMHGCLPHEVCSV